MAPNTWIVPTRLQRPSTPPGIPPPDAARPTSKLSFGVVCSSNINRSMEAHVVLGNAGLQVESYGTGTQVRLPGKSSMEPRIFKFGTPYSEMYKSMATTPEDQAFFSRNGVLQLCRRGAAVKVSFSLFPLFPTFCNLPIINIKIQVGTSTMARYAI